MGSQFMFTTTTTIFDFNYLNQIKRPSSEGIRQTKLTRRASTLSQSKSNSNTKQNDLLGPRFNNENFITKELCKEYLEKLKLKNTLEREKTLCAYESIRESNKHKFEFCIKNCEEKENLTCRNNDDFVKTLNSIRLTNYSGNQKQLKLEKTKVFEKRLNSIEIVDLSFSDNQSESEDSSLDLSIEKESTFKFLQKTSTQNDDECASLSVSSLNSDTKRQFKSQWPAIETIENLIGMRIRPPEPQIQFEEVKIEITPIESDSAKGKKKKPEAKKSAITSKKSPIPKSPSINKKKATLKSPISSIRSIKSTKEDIAEKQVSKALDVPHPIVEPLQSQQTQSPPTQTVEIQQILTIQSPVIKRELPSALCPSSLDFSKKLAVNRWINNCNFSASMKIFPLI